MTPINLLFIYVQNYYNLIDLVPSKTAPTSTPRIGMDDTNCVALAKRILKLTKTTTISTSSNLPNYPKDHSNIGTDHCFFQ